MARRNFKAIGLAIVAFVSTSGMAGADALDGAYRGMIVCEKLQTSQFMLRTPFDIMITVGSEIATGTVGDDGTIKLSSNWHSYGGTLTGKGGKLTGTQA